MGGNPFDETSPAPDYEPSGWFNVLTLWPLLALGIVVALVMALVLLLAESDLYYYFLTPALVGAPVFGAIWAVVRLAHCRNPLVGTLVGLTLGVIYYLGYWELSYLGNVVSQGPGPVAMVRAIGGAPGLPGYVNFRCKTSKPIAHHGAPPANAVAPNRMDYVFNYVLFGGEALMIGAIAVAIGRGGAQRVYYEEARRWSSKVEFRLPPATLPTLLRAIEAGDWAAVAALPRVASKGNANTASLLFRLEYLAGSTDEPAYLSLTASNVGKIPLQGADGAPMARLKRGAILRQVAIDAASARALAAQFPDVKLAPPAAAGTSPAAADAIGPDVGASTRKGRPAIDFREPAVAATRAILDEDEQARAWAVDASCCLPTGAGKRAVRSAVWWKYKAIALSFILFFAGLFLAVLAEGQKGAQGGRPPVATLLIYVGGIGAVVGGVLMLGLCFGGDTIQKRFLKRKLARRPGSLLEAADGLPTRIFRMEDAKTYHVQKLCPEDLCVCAFDRDQQRVLLEGVSHRYVIRGEDVTNFWPLQSGERISLRIDYRVDEAPLNLMLTADNPLAYLFHGIFARRTLEKVAQRFVESFGHDVPGGDQPVAHSR